MPAKTPEEMATLSEHTGLAAPQSQAGYAARFLASMQRRTMPDMLPGKTLASRVAQVSLAHLVTGAGGDQAPAHIFGRVVPEKLAGEALEEELVAIAEEVAQQVAWHSQTHDRVQAYAFVLYNKGGEVLQQCRVNAGPTTRQLAVGGETEPPTEMGLTAQHMRHTEVSMRMMLEKDTVVLSAFSEENDRLRTETQSLRTELSLMRAEAETERKKRSEQYDLMEALRDGKAKRELEMEELRQTNERAERIMNYALERILPEVLMKYGAENPIKEQLDEFNQDLEPEQIGELIAILRPKQQAILWKMLPEGKRREFQAKMAGQNGVTTPLITPAPAEKAEAAAANGGKAKPS